MPPRIAKLLGLGAFGAIGFFVLLFAYVAWLSAPSHTGWMQPVLSWVSWISLAMVFLAIIGTHVFLGRQLLALSREG
jgi:hypothetical protein